MGNCSFFEELNMSESLLNKYKWSVVVLFRLSGVEISGVIHDMCNSMPNGNFNMGDPVIIFPGEDIVHDSYQEFIAIDDTENVIQVPNTIPLEIASMLPGSALSAYNAVLKALPHVTKLQQVKPCVNVLIVGAGSLGLWTQRLAHYLIGASSTNIKIYVADNSIDKLITAQEHDCHDIIHWCEEDHEQYIIERTLDACRGGGLHQLAQDHDEVAEMSQQRGSNSCGW